MESHRRINPLPLLATEIDCRRIFRRGLWTSAAVLGLLVACAAPGATPAGEPPPRAAPDRHAGSESSAEATPADPAKIARLIAELGHSDFFVRERAQQQLEKIGYDAFDALQAAASHEDLEIAARARYLLRLLRVDLTRKGDPEEVRRLLADYDSLSPAQRRERIEKLARLPDAKGADAIGRLILYERSPLLAKVAAIALIADNPTSPPRGATVRGLSDLLQRSSRPPAQWVQTWLTWTSDSSAALSQWIKHVETEFRLQQEGSNDSSAEIVGGLLKIQFHWLKQLQKPDEAMAVAARMIELHIAEPETLLELTRWLIAQKAWKLIEELAQRNPAPFQDQPILAYARAYAVKQMGDGARAEQLAAAALAAAPGRELQPLLEHLRTAIALKQMGIFQWAEAEYRHVIGQMPGNHPLAANARFSLAEMLHDQQRDDAAAKVLQEVLAAAGGDRPQAVLADRSTAEIASRMHFFFACDAERQGRRDQQKDHLLQGLAADEPDIDLLIMAHRFDGLSPEQRESVAAKIKRIADELLQDIANEPDNPMHMNQYAWLVGNTADDRAVLGVALKHSLRSLELSPNNAGYLDTLAHVYAAMGDYEKAVHHQSRAAEIEPHNGLITRQLEKFKEQWRRKKAAAAGS